LPLTTKLVRSARLTPVWLFTGPHPDVSKVRALEEQGVRVSRVTQIGEHLWLPAVTEALAAAGVTRLLVEGGSQIWRAFGRAGLVDEIIVFRAAPSPDAATATQQPGIGDVLTPYLDAGGFDLVESRQLAADEMLHFRLRRSTISRSKGANS
jgi:diaminohydroxyphosphoribosylaminopyrimidine deaminase/5-amino-6-(5-phosphoribosylamino)uracil reductase